MPDGFNPHVELDRAYNLRDMMQACRQRTSVTLNIIDDIFADPEVSYETKLKAIDMVWNRGFGKTRQHIYISDGNQTEEQRVKVYLPDNGRATLVATTIEAKDV